MVSQRTRQLRMQKTAIRLARRSASAVLSLPPALQPDFKILWNISIFHRMAHQLIFSIASERLRTGRSVISFDSIGFRPFGAPRSLARITVRSRAG
ncbi:hypothetical protein WN73_11915 [Bradyrhizobium sp. CCBAU 45394]|nr:hypothetical protein [Bradyrhizobium sp. CCBAU 45394]MDA9535811.1 hypothetical protein [Bradyrhizobium sp. CCBAU 21362]